MPAATSRCPSLKKTGLFLGVVGLITWHWLSTRPITQPPGMMIPEEPVQGGLPAGKVPWMVSGTRIVPLASYRIKARVLHTERYRFERMADLAPLDLGVGWRVMSDETWASASEFSNANRYLSWHYKDPNFPGEASICISNMHLLPANDRVRDKLLSLRKGELVQLNGYLVEVQRPGMNPWTSSLSRFDRGDGACEIMWVESALPVKVTPLSSTPKL